MGAGKGKSRRTQTATIAVKSAVGGPTNPISGVKASLGNASIFAMASSRADLENFEKFPNLNFDPFTIVEESELPVTQRKYWLDYMNGFTDPQSGFSLSIPEALPYKNSGSERKNPRYQYGSLVVYANVIDGNKPIGDFIFTVNPDEHGDFEMRVGAIELRHYLHGEKVEPRSYEKTGRGFGAACIGEFQRLAREGGAKRISLFAVGGGSYFWHKMGFGLDIREYGPSGEPKDWSLTEAEKYSAAVMTTRILQRMQDLAAFDSKIREEAQTFEASVQSDPPTSLKEILERIPSREVMHHRTERLQPLAATIMDQVEWHGVCFL